MDPAIIESRLLLAEESPDFIAECRSITAELKSCDSDLKSVGVILRFMEDHPTLDFGSPGPLVHYVEKFYGSGYEEELLESVSRHPIPQTTWMLNRLINGAKEANDRERLIAIMRAVLSHPKADADTQQEAAHFLEHQAQ
jgi:hypothetical protein